MLQNTQTLKLFRTNIKTEIVKNAKLGVERSRNLLKEGV
jgi:hypothetical protein